MGHSGIQSSCRTQANSQQIPTYMKYDCMFNVSIEFSNFAHKIPFVTIRIEIFAMIKTQKLLSCCETRLWNKTRIKYKMQNEITHEQRIKTKMLHFRSHVYKCAWIDVKMTIPLSSLNLFVYSLNVHCYRLNDWNRTGSRQAVDDVHGWGLSSLMGLVEFNFGYVKINRLREQR